MSYRAEIALMLKDMPPHWREMYNSGRRKLKAGGGAHLPETPTPEQAMQLIGITAGGNQSGDVPKGQHKVPTKVRDEAMLGIRLSYDHNYGAWDFIGLARAIQLAISPGVPDSTHKRMRNYFTRHLKDKKSARFGSKSSPSRGYMAWLNWGGDAGAKWVGAKTKGNPSLSLKYAQANPRPKYAQARTNNHFEIYEPFHRRSD
jgi:hypothetical protein